MPHGPPPVNRRDRRPARVTQLERNARIAQRARRPPPSRPPTGSPPAPECRRWFSHAVAARGDAREPSRPPPRAEHPARAQCTHCAARRRPPPPSRRPAWPPPALEHRHRFSHAVAARAVAREPSRPPPRAEHPARAQCAHCAARARRPPPSRPPTRSPAALEHRRRFLPRRRRAGAAREPSRPPPRAEPPSRAQCMHCAARRRPPPPSRPPTGSPPAPECRRWFSMPPPRGRRPRTVATVAPRGTSVQSAMRALRSSSAAAATVAAADRVTASARTPPPVVRRSRRDGPARYFGRAPAHRGTPGQVRRSRCARSPMAAAAVAAPNPGTAPPPTAFSILPAPSHRRAVYRIRAPGQVSHITTGPRASSVFHNQHRCGKRRAADALAM